MLHVHKIVIKNRTECYLFIHEQILSNQSLQISFKFVSIPAVKALIARGMNPAIFSWHSACSSASNPFWGFIQNAKIEFKCNKYNPQSNGSRISADFRIESLIFHFPEISGCSCPALRTTEFC